ncbi:hypothetical protein AB4510_18835 [Vibrio sp. 10N.222.54.B12]|uniref:hypothetical protein n=1 Tax=unclassified Vibrio TaxID=2614977 RepID=UPI0010BDEF07|nr:hypothetical protein [Vibrio sp. F13]TKF72844.1 hypothetical protein FCV55_04885 [Vibrio sp. F13]TKF88094.1 hypothetical protein FCV73_19560 [Vibrio sp. F13]
MKIVLILLAFISMNADAAFKVLNITTRLDVGNLYTNSITSVEFIPAVLELASNQDKTKFDDVNTTLRIETDIPFESSDIPYVSTLTKNTSTCTDYSGVSNVQDDFVQLTIDGQSISEGESVSFLNFNLNDGDNKYSEHDIVLNFKSFKDITTTGQPERCNGEIEFNIEVDV